MSNVVAPPTAEWFFDFVSPFAYLQLEQFDRLPAGLAIRPVPVVLGALLTYWENRGPAEIPAKRTFTYRMAQYRAESLGIPFKMPPAHPFNPIKALRLAVVCGNNLGAIREIFRFIWRDGRGIWDEQDWRELCSRLDLADPDRAIEQPEVKDALRSFTDHAISLGVFGVPTLHCNGELFWGNDATDLFLHVQNHPDWLQSEELQRISKLPVGVQRK
jgi:2-hydroxychromene-2-carboxylate isomerase